MERSVIILAASLADGGFDFQKLDVVCRTQHLTLELPKVGRNVLVRVRTGMHEVSSPAFELTPEALNWAACEVRAMLDVGGLLRIPA